MSTVTWPEAVEHFREPKVYWLATVTPAGEPHSVPVWGVVLDDAIYLYSEPGTIKARNIAKNPAVVVHLESGSDVAIIKGRAIEVPLGDEFDAVSAAFASKYSEPSEADYLPTNDGATLAWRVEPVSAMTWQLEDMEGSMRRWRANNT